MACALLNPEAEPFNFQLSTQALPTPQPVDSELTIFTAGFSCKCLGSKMQNTFKVFQHGESELNWTGRGRKWIRTLQYSRLHYATTLYLVLVFGMSLVRFPCWSDMVCRANIDMRYADKLICLRNALPLPHSEGFVMLRVCHNHILCCWKTWIPWIVAAPTQPKMSGSSELSQSACWKWIGDDEPIMWIWLNIELNFNLWMLNRDCWSPPEALLLPGQIWRWHCVNLVSLAISPMWASSKQAITEFHKDVFVSSLYVSETTCFRYRPKQLLTWFLTSWKHWNVRSFRP